MSVTERLPPNKFLLFLFFWRFSRNKFLSIEEKQKAAFLREIILTCGEKIKNGNKNYSQIKDDAISSLNQQSFKVDYFEICNTYDLEDANEKDTNHKEKGAGFVTI